MILIYNLYNYATVSIFFKDIFNLIVCMLFSSLYLNIIHTYNMSEVTVIYFMQNTIDFVFPQIIFHNVAAYGFKIQSFKLILTILLSDEK